MSANQLQTLSDALGGADVEFAANHVIVRGNAHCTSLVRLDDDVVFDLFKQYGAILFRNLSIEYAAFDSITRRHCSGFLSQAAALRKSLLNDPATQTVNLGNSAFPYHPELSQFPWQPDIAWFCCVETPRHKNEGTIICDGVELVNILNPDDRDLLANNNLLYSGQYPREGLCNAFEIELPADNGILWRDDSRVFSYEIRDGETWTCYTCAGLPIPLFSDAPAFNNFMIFSRLLAQKEDYPVWADGTPIRDDFIQRVSDKADTIAAQMDWQKGDLLMLNNTRFMHARPSVIDPDARMIMTRFGYARRHPWRDNLAQHSPWRRDGVIFSQFEGVISTSCPEGRQPP